MTKPQEEDIVIQGAKLCDWLRDLVLLSGNVIEYDNRYILVRRYFGETILDLVKAIKDD